MSPLRSGINKKCFKVQRRKNLLKHIETSVRRLKAEMEEICEEQRGIREGQRQVREKFRVIEAECEQLKMETRLVLQQSARNKIRLVLMFKILKARETGDFVEATKLAGLLRAMIARENTQINRNMIKEEASNASIGQEEC